MSNDEVSIENMDSNAQWYKRFHKTMPEGKKFRSYPAVKIGRFGVNSSYQNQGLGTIVLDYIKALFITNNRTGCMFITVDAYTQSLRFYEKNDFPFLCKKDLESNTRLMYYDLRQLVYN